MSELTLLILRIGFLLLLWLFIFSIVYALRSDLFGAPVRKLPNDASTRRSTESQAAPDPVPVPVGSTQPASPPVITPSGGALPPAGATSRAATLVITSGVAAGTAIPLDDEMITIGRSTDSTLVIVDEYTSTYHARLARHGDQWLLTDLDSTNGTKLNGTRVTGTVTVPVFTPITIGTTTFELRP
ncbi:FHA domain-containing protein FhaB/FipA [Leucobacter sp. W1038]|uniref:FHA domain-containing protein FhaB/FipA n=1 Tax=Leucobacter sp. W1038 TaxID=3438281 RepID=UPI003D972E1F